MNPMVPAKRRDRRCVFVLESVGSPPPIKDGKAGFSAEMVGISNFRKSSGLKFGCFKSDAFTESNSGGIGSSKLNKDATELIMRVNMEGQGSPSGGEAPKNCHLESIK